MDEDQEVDLQLFITCRLCLDEPGLYQIIPQLRAQINYCLGIDIDPFDGLPQLICKKCKCVLNEYHAIKSKFEDKQVQLLNRSLKHNKVSLPVEQAQNNQTLSGLDVGHDSIGETLAEVINAASRNHTEISNSPDVVSNSYSKKKDNSWKKAYSEHFVCTICSKNYLTVKSVKKHMSTHRTIMRKHDKVFKKYLTIEMNKIDKIKNSTGRAQHVVYNKNKIISKWINSKYYSFYLKKACDGNNESDENDNVVIVSPVNRASDGKRRLSVSSDEIVITGKKRKTHRLFSNSSSDTVVLNISNEDCTGNIHTAQTDRPKPLNSTESVNDECINLDDTSCDSVRPETNKGRVIQRQPVKANVGDYKSIQNIVTMCQKNYIKKIQAETNVLNEKPSFSESSLKHKVLSLGRKVINKQGFSCTGILRYMEHKDLAINWKPTSVAMQNKGSQFVRINTKLKSREDSENEETGWKNIKDVLVSRDSGKKNNTSEKLSTIKNQIESQPEQVLQPNHTDQAVGLHHTDEVPLLVGACNTSVNCKTPVSNLKSLNEQSQTIKVEPIIHSVEIPMYLQSDFVGDPPVEEGNMCMPTITSTMSLSEEKKVATEIDTPAPSLKDKTSLSEEVAPVTEAPPPRIKVKPPSELMSKRALSNHVASSDMWAYNVAHGNLPLHVNPNGIDPGPSTSSAQSVLEPTAAATAPETNRDRKHDPNLAFVILNCPELPNTRTDAPFQYFRKLLLFHELQLLELNEDLSEDFHCLVRFKLLLKQHTKNTITVLLSLFCSENRFCFTFKDAKFVKFDPNKLPAFWQWELLKVYKGDVVDKVLVNASKIGKEVHEKTKHFLCLLKSIDLMSVH